MIRRVCFFVCLMCGWCCAAFSQNIRGKVLDAHNDAPLSFANVAILQPQDSSVVTGAVTDDNGLFNVAVPQGDWLVRISLIGYEPYTAAVVQADLGTVRLQPAREVLSEVVVTGHAKMFNLEDGGISADVQNTPLKDMGSLSDVLGQMPFVSKSGTSFTVLGKGSPIFYINNRLVRDNNDLLRIQSSEVKKVTVITNPGAEYDASVNAVIKIETYRPVGEGFSMDLWTYNRYNSEWYTMDRASFNYRNKNLDIFADMNYANMAIPKDRVWNTEIETDEGVRSVVSRRSDMDKVKFYTPKVGFNYIVNDKHSFGVQYEYSNTYDNPHDYDIDTESALEGVADAPVHTRTLGNSDSYSHYVNAYYNGQLTDWLNAK